MDIKDLYTADVHEAGSEMHVEGPDGKPIDFFITLVGKDSKKWRAIKRKYERDMLMDKDPERDYVAEMLADAVISWRGDGIQKFTRKAALELFINAPYILDQANVFVGTRSNFMSK